MITATPPPAKTSSKKIVDLWASLPTSYSEADLGANFIADVIEQQGFTGKQVNTRLINFAQTKQAEFQEKPVICWQNSQITKLFHKLTTEVFLGHNHTNK